MLPQFLTNKKRYIVALGDEISSIESLQYDFLVTQEATNGFSEANKLGQGGFGAVYKVNIVTVPLFGYRKIYNYLRHCFYTYVI